jgi:hypothetical protein
MREKEENASEDKESKLILQVINTIGGRPECLKFSHVVSYMFSSKV